MQIWRFNNNSKISIKFSKPKVSYERYRHLFDDINYGIYLYKDGIINITNSLMRKNIRMEASYLKLNDGIRGWLKREVGPSNLK
jgi:hypothetical protein